MLTAEKTPRYKAQKFLKKTENSPKALIHIDFTDLARVLIRLYWAAREHLHFYDQRKHYETDYRRY